MLRTTVTMRCTDMRSVFQFLLGCYAKPVEGRRPHTHRFQFLLGCYPHPPQRASPCYRPLSIPFGMLHPMETELDLGSGATFNSFWDATKSYKLQHHHLKCCFQFLLGCYRRRVRQARLSTSMLSIPFGMLPD